MAVPFEGGGGLKTVQNSREGASDNTEFIGGGSGYSEFGGGVDKRKQNEFFSIPKLLSNVLLNQTANLPRNSQE